MPTFSRAFTASMLLTTALLGSQAGLADPQQGLSSKPDEAQAIRLGVRIDETAYTSTLSSDQACALLQRLQDRTEIDDHYFALAAYSGALVANRALLSANKLSSVKQAEAVARAAKAAEETYIKRFSGTQGLGERIAIEGSDTMAKAIQKGGGRKIVGNSGHVYASLMEFVRSGEFRSDLMTRTLMKHESAGVMLSEKTIESAAFGKYFEILERNVTDLTRSRGLDSLFEECATNPGRCKSWVSERVYGGGTGFSHVRRSLQDAIHGAVKAVLQEKIRKSENFMIQAALKGKGAVSCVKYGEKAFKAGGLLLAITADLTTAERSYAGDEVMKMMEDPSILLQKSHAKDGCAYLEREPELRERFARMAELTAAAEQKSFAAKHEKEHRDDIVCGGPNDTGMRDAETEAQIATGHFRRAQASDYVKVVPGNDLFSQRIREGMATSAQVVPVTE